MPEYKIVPLSLALLTLKAAGEFTLDPTLHINGVIGETSASSVADVATHEHDPNNNFALQGAEVGLNLKLDDWLAGFANINTFTTEDHELESEWEEGFLKFITPIGLEVRGGRFLNRVGLQNHIHLHGWRFVNANLTTSTFLGEEGLTTEGGELTWSREFDQSLFALTGSFGNAALHSEEEGEEEEEEHSESLENAFFADEVITARMLYRYRNTDFHQHQFGLNGAWGENGFGVGNDTSLYSFDYTYTWRENGLEAGGRELSLGLELTYRDVEWTHPENALNQGSTGQSSIMVFSQYRFHEDWSIAARFEHLQGRQAGAELDDGVTEYAFDIEERDRLSLALTREFELGNLDSYARLQYDHDDLEGSSENTVWLQFGFNYGDREIR